MSYENYKQLVDQAQIILNDLDIINYNLSNLSEIEKVDFISMYSKIEEQESVTTEFLSEGVKEDLNELVGTFYVNELELKKVELENELENLLGGD